MNVLEKILEEIKKRLNMVKNIPVNEEDDFLDGEECYENGRVQGRYEELVVCQEIIRSHMEEADDSNITGNEEPYITLTLNEDGVVEVYDDTYDVTIHCESEEEQERVVGILERYQGWIPVEDTEHTPEDESYVLVSFSNFSLPDIARYEENDEGGTYYPGDDEKSYLNYRLFVNAWMPLPKSHRTEDI